jgi:biopolymer transport protein ExbD
MIDVMLVLLVIFMVATPALVMGFPAVPPRAEHLRDHPETRIDHVLGIDAAREFYFDKQPVRREDLRRLLTAAYRGRADNRVLYLRADRDLDYEVILDGLDEAAKSGVAVVGMISERETPPAGLAEPRRLRGRTR